MKRALGLAALLLSGCFPNLTVPDDAQIFCESGDDCPDDTRCETAINRCIANTNPDDAPPALDGAPVIDPPAATRGDTVRVTFAVDEALFRDPEVSVAFADEETASATLRDADGQRYTFDFAVDDDAAEGAADLRAAVVDLAGNAAQLDLGAVVLDFEPPTEVAVSAPAAAVSDPEVTLTLAAVGATSIVLDGDLADGDNVRAPFPFATTATVRLADGDGRKVVLARFLDDAGNEAQATAAVDLITNIPVSDPVLISPWPADDPGALNKVKNNDVATVTGTVSLDASLVAASLVSVDDEGAPLVGAGCEVGAAEVTVASGIINGTVNVGAPCAGAVAVALRVVVQNAAGIRSDAAASLSATLALDNTPPANPTATLAVVAPARAGFARTEAVVVQTAADDPDGEGIEAKLAGDVLPGTFVDDFEPAGDFAVDLAPGDGAKLVTAVFRDAVENETAPIALNLVLDSAPPADAVLANTALVESSTDPLNPAVVDDANNPVALRGDFDGDRVEVHSSPADLAAEPPTTLLATVDLTAGVADSLIPRTADKTWDLVALDPAGNRSGVVTASLPSFLNTVIDPNPAGLTQRINFETEVSAGISNPAVSLNGNAAFAFEDVGFGGEVLIFATLFPQEDDPDFPDETVVRVSATPDGLRADSVTTAAFAVTLDVSAPVLDPAAVIVVENDPGAADTIAGAISAADDNRSPTDALQVELYEPNETFFNPVRAIAVVPVAADGSFAATDVGDNARDGVNVVVVDELANRTTPLLVANDIAGPAVANLNVSPAVARDGTAVTVTFDLSDAHDLRALPAVTVGGRAAAHVAGDLTASDGESFTYAFSVDSAQEVEGVNAVVIDLLDDVGNTNDGSAALLVDFTPPVSVNVAPGALAAWNGAPAILGTATDDRSGLDRVELSLRDDTAGLFFNGVDAFDAATEVLITAAGAAGWSLATPTMVNGRTYTLRSFATDLAGNPEVANTHTFTFNDVPVDVPLNLAAASGLEAHVTLTWDEPAAGQPDLYRVHYGDVGGAFGGTSVEAGDSPIELPGTVTNLDVVGLDRGRYDFAVTAVVGADESPFSNTEAAASRWWEWKNPALGVASLGASTSPAPGVVVAAGESGTMVLFRDGVLESLPAAPANLTAGFTTASASVFVGASGLVMRSVDGGQTWVQGQNLQNTPLADVWGEGDLFIAVGSGGRIFRSVDAGVTWVNIPSNLAGNTGIRDVEGDGLNIVVAGTSGQLAFSTDGGASFVNPGQLTTQFYGGVLGEGVTFIGFAGGGVIVRTADITDLGNNPWQQIVAPQTNQLVAGLITSAGFVLGDAAGEYWLSEDQGATWVKTNDRATRPLRFATVGDTVIAAGDLGGNGAGSTMRSVDGGRSWTEIPTGAHRQHNTIAFDGARFVAAGSAMSVAVSDDDGETWDPTGSALTIEQLDAVSATGDYLVAGGRNGALVVSLDEGESWSLIDAGVTADLLDAIVVGSRAVVVGESGVILTSDDGATWVTASSGVGTDVNAVTHDGTRFLAVSGTRLLTSDDGVTWANTSIAPAEMSDVAAEGDRIVVTTLGTNVGASTDGGQSFTFVATGNNRFYFRAFHSGGRFFAVGGNDVRGFRFSNEGYIATSDDGQLWSLDVSVGGGRSDVWAEGGTVITTGRSNVIRSVDNGTNFPETIFVGGDLFAVRGEGDFVVIARTAAQAQGSIGLSFDRGASWADPTRIQPTGPAGFHTAVDAFAGGAVVVGAQGAIAVYGPR
jgi:photosystem II stability/assembly factor-like uncharacterized protein